MTQTVAIICAEFNDAISSAMIASARAEAARLGLASTVVKVPGCYEVPLAVARALDDRPAAVAVLGYIERGETQHGEVMGHVVHAALVELSLAHRTPIGIGIIGPGATEAQAQVRKESYAAAAVRAAARMLGITAPPA